ncbi:PorT family protein [Flavobacterium amnicola]|uniref:PorT family protein n=1 Tax=Flavobacterium amnicola TaxID=2506422 RepID=A0A4Q1K6G7_9FLAO|nr:porin family protein [Flavobacterium amnicola]RXR21212.1 PorT family protein [Flavobacterium amnicola]
MRKLFSFLLLLLASAFYSQTVPDFEAIDSLYREDQFYFSTTYNIFSKKPSGVSQNSFSVGLSTGFLRDFPINKKRTVAIAPGLGFSYNNYKQNLVISEMANTTSYSLIASDVALDKNKLSFLSVDVPLEFRWRTSTFESHKFWRIYTGIKASYVIMSRSKYIADNGNYTVVNNPDINKFQYGAYISAGYNTWNLYTYYGLNSIFNKDILSPNGNLKTLNIGLMFYIL